MQAIQAVPFKQMNPTTAQALRDVLDNPSFYRRMPTQTIECDPELFSFLVRKPEVMVNTWDLMGITKVTAKRTGPYSFLANDGVGTKCKCDLVYGADNIHIYYGAGDYDGSMSARLIKGRAVCILRSDNQAYPQGHSGHVVRGTMDVFLKLDNLGADLLTRTFGPLVAKTADHNFAETAQFVSQLSQICAKNPPAALGLASQLDNIDEPVRQEFASIATRIAEDCQVAKKATSGSMADPALMAHTLQELKSASGLNNAAHVRSAESATRPSSPLSKEGASAVPPMQLSLSNSNSARKQPANSDSGQVQSAVKHNMNDLPPSRILPKKTGVTMRR
jgi:hypothetical protein